MHFRQNFILGWIIFEIDIDATRLRAYFSDNHLNRERLDQLNTIIIIIHDNHNHHHHHQILATIEQGTRGPAKFQQRKECNLNRQLSHRIF